jgi:hypothetical protein
VFISLSQFHVGCVHLPYRKSIQPEKKCIKVYGKLFALNNLDASHTTECKKTVQSFVDTKVQ